MFLTANNKSTTKNIMINMHYIINLYSIKFNKTK